ncbi:helix-turn-helix domain-containing protein [Streptomyces syringium]|uniref:helix-turn-helix domain-containing protein n=1 Tax=Streptomyces syringium TaxID=76729 RepID=UPI00365085CA
MTASQPMQGNSTSTVLGRRLGGELIKLRTAAGMTQPQAAKVLSASTTKVAKMERGWVPIRDPDIRALCELYGTTEPTVVGGLLELARIDRERRKVKGWWSSLPRDVREYIELENVATSIKTWQVSYVPGLLQSPDYVRALQRTEQLAAARLERQRRLVDTPPLTFHAVIHEAALRCQVGGAGVMGGQLDHLSQVSRKPNVTLQVLPFQAGSHRALGAAFNVISFADPGAMDVVYMEAPLIQQWAEGGEEAAQHAALFESVASAALSPDDSRALISSIRKEL